MLVWALFPRPIRMNLEILPLMGFAFVASITPGPNNTLLMAAGARSGLRASLPLVTGIFFGFSFMLFAVGMGLGKVFLIWPSLHMALKFLGTGYLLWLAWKLVRSEPVPPGDSPRARPLSFLQAAGLQWVNPKAWYMAAGAMSIFVPQGAPPLPAVAAVTGLFMLAGFPCCLAWFFFGTAMSGFLTNRLRVRVFNIVMALLLVISVVPILF